MSNFENHPPPFNEQGFTNPSRKSPTNGKRYDCKQCPKNFTRPSALKTHVYTHTGERPHGCDIPGCGSRFAVISNLRRHLRVHRPSHVKRRLTSQERHGYLERLMKRTDETHRYNIDEGHMHYNTLPSMCYSSSSSSASSSPRGSMSPTMESTIYRRLKPKETRAPALEVKNLLN
ncbi:hypothetical protein INT48_004355 [Thamnidium elegans]|uniref:C2H2-type domain-containing protein n=1 Tax=Thamnidium elegans TaxID=101142 RepID=A0A8H7VVE0_9FUNG|nr:hypothetical protein INT48_004355 [Thamnidium elegans]